MGSDERARLPLVLDALREIDWETHLRDASGDTSRLSFVSGLLLGLVFGALVALALAPQSGRRTRQQVRETGIELRARVPRRATLAPDETLADEGEQAEI